jgi:hypothetical protein
LEIAVDANGNSYVSGGFTGALPLGGNTLISAGKTDAFVAKIDSAGNPQWAKQFGGLEYQWIEGVATDSLGNVVVVGEFDSAVSFDGVNTVTAQGTDAFVVKLTPNGTVLWVKTFNEGVGNGNGTQNIAAVAIDKNNDVIVTGSYANGMATGIVLGATSLLGKGGTEFFVAKLKGSDGSALWANGAGDVGSHHGNRVQVDAAGNIVVAGEFTNTMTLGATALTASAGGNDIFVARLTTLGAYSWAHNWGSGKSDSLNGLAINSIGDVIFAGVFQGTLNLGAGLTAPVNVLGFNSYVGKLNSAGQTLWSQQFGSSSGASAFINLVEGLSVDSLDNIYLAGGCGGTFDVGATLNCGPAAYQHGTPFLIRLTSAGVLGFSRTFGTGAGFIDRSSARGAGSLWIVGRNNAGMDLGTGVQPSVSGSDLIVSTIVTN